MHGISHRAQKMSAAEGSRTTRTVPAPAAPIPQSRPLTLHDPYGADDMEFLLAFYWSALRSLAIPQSNINMDSGIEAGLTPKPPQPAPPPLIFTLIRQAFSYLQMQLPSTYFHRVKAIIQESGISMADFNSMQRRGMLRGLREVTGAICSPAMLGIDPLHTNRFKEQWKEFVQRCMEEWKNLNITSALLLR